MLITAHRHHDGRGALSDTNTVYCSPMRPAKEEGRGECPGVSCMEDEHSDRYALKEAMKYKRQAVRHAFEMWYGEHSEEEKKKVSFCKIALL